jgi:hypothetical protein
MLGLGMCTGAGTPVPASDGSIKPDSNFIHLPTKK